jgi:hypothetical protein
VHGVMDHVCGSVEQTDLAAINDLALGIDENKIRGLDQRESYTKRINPEVGRLNWVLRTVSICVLLPYFDCILLDAYSKCNVPGNTLVEAVFAENAECSSESSLEICTLLVWVVELWWLGEIKRFLLASLLIETWLQRCSGVGLPVVAILRLNC